MRRAVARTAALAVYARFLSRTFAVLFASRRRWDDNAAAFAIHVWYLELGTFADQRPHRRTVEDAATGCRSARIQLLARFYTLLADARKSARAIVVVLAFGADVKQDSLAVRQRIAVRQVLGAFAVRDMVADEADGILGARRVVFARVDAVAVDAGLV